MFTQNKGQKRKNICQITDLHKCNPDLVSVEQYWFMKIITSIALKPQVMTNI